MKEFLAWVIVLFILTLAVSLSAQIHQLSMEQFRGGTEGRQNVTRAGYAIEIDNWKLGAAVSAIWDDQGHKSAFTGIVLTAGKRIDTGRVWGLEPAAIIGNEKNCWEYGIQLAFTGKGGAFTAGPSSFISYLIDLNRPATPVWGIGVTARINVL